MTTFRSFSDDAAAVLNFQKQMVAFILHRTYIFLVLAWLSAASIILADNGAVTIETKDGTIHSGQTFRCDAAQFVMVSSGAEHAISVDNVVRVVYADRKPNSNPGLFVQLSNGDRLSAKSITIADEKVRINSPLKKHEFNLNLEWLSSISRGDRVGEAARGGDQVWIQGGDVVTGELQELSADSVHLNSKLGKISFNVEQVQRIAFDPELQLKSPVLTTGWDVTLRDGSQLSCAKIESEKEELKLHWSPVGKRSVQISDVLRLDRRSTDFIRIQLADAETRVERSFFGEPFESRMNEQSAGGFLKLKSVPFRYGIGTIAHSKLTFPIPKSANRFRVQCGLADPKAPNGSAVASIEIDGTQVWEESLLRGAESTISIDLAPNPNAEKLTLIVDFGDKADVQSFVNWCEPLFIR